MICARCDKETLETPCTACGGDPDLDGRYRLLSTLGAGAAGTTWRALRLSDGAAVALKETPLGRGVSPKARALLLREASVLRQLKHPQIPRYVDDFIISEGRHSSVVLVQELVEGQDLGAELASRRYSEDEVLDALAGLLPVLVYLHGLSPPVIHRDLKPRNVMRRPDGSLALIDFGAVRDAIADPDLGGSTVAGTFGYMAPEQFAGDASPATDLYGLGALAVALLTRKEPRTMVSGGALRWTAHATPSPAVRQLLERALDADPRRRPDSAAALLAEIRALRASPIPRTQAAPRARASPMTLAAALAALEEAPTAKVAEPLRASPLRPEALPQLPLHAADASLAGAGQKPRLGPVLALGGFSFVIAAALGVLVAFVPDAEPITPQPNPIAAVLPAPVATPACAVTTHQTQVAVPSGTSRYQILGTSDDGSRMAMIVGRALDGRGQLIVYEAGARESLKTVTANPELVAEGWEALVDGLVTDNAGGLASLGIVLDQQPTAVSWCQDSGGVLIEGEAFSYQTFSESCGLSGGYNTSYSLCPAGAEELGGCVVPPKLTIGCWEDAPALVDIYTAGDTIWTVAERPNGATLPRFAAGLTR